MSIQIKHSRRIPTDTELDNARAIMADVEGGSVLTAEQQAAMALLGQCGPTCECGDCPPVPFEIHAADDDPIAPDALIGYVSRADYPEGKYVAMLLDLDNITQDPPPVKTWLGAGDSFEAAENQVRTYYATWLARYLRHQG